MALPAANWTAIGAIATTLTFVYQAILPLLKKRQSSAR